MATEAGRVLGRTEQRFGNKGTTRQLVFVMLAMRRAQRGNGRSELVANTDFVSLRFSTNGAAPKRCLQAAYEVFGSFIARRSCHLSDPSGQVEMTVWGPAQNGPSPRVSADACVQRVAYTTGFTSQRTPELLTDGNDDISLNIQETGRCFVSHVGREAAAETGGGFCTSNADVSTVILSGPARFTSIGLPRKLMMAMVPGIEDALARALPPDVGALRLLVRYLDVIEDEQALKTAELRRAATTHVHDLCALAIGATRDAAEVAKGRGLRAARLRVLKADITQSLDSGHISADMLARRHRVTPRYIRKLFEDQGTTLSRFVLNQRLALIHRLLTDPRHGHRTIGALALEVGFGDLSTFNREFRRYYGATPSDVRAAAAK
jgi:AraC-like DNA-binding protein